MRQQELSCGDGQVSIEGAWVLDLSRSETMVRYLQVSGVPENNIGAHVRAERKRGGLNIIQLEESTFTIHKQTYANNFTESFEVGEEKVTYDSYSGARKSAMVSVPDSGPSGYVHSARTTINSGREEVQLVETRYVIDGGSSHVQEIYFCNLTTGQECTTTRTWRRISMNHEHRATLALLMMSQASAQ